MWGVGGVRGVLVSTQVGVHCESCPRRGGRECLLWRGQRSEDTLGRTSRVGGDEEW